MIVFRISTMRAYTLTDVTFTIAALYSNTFVTHARFQHKQHSYNKVYYSCSLFLILLRISTIRAYTLIDVTYTIAALHSNTIVTHATFLLWHSPPSHTESRWVTRPGERWICRSLTSPYIPNQQKRGFQRNNNFYVRCDECNHKKRCPNDPSLDLKI